MTRHLIITADDFGLAVAVNEAVEQAHRFGVLSSTSLLIAGGAAPDAITRARRNPGLRVGLHVAVCEGQPVLPARELPTLVDRATGRFHSPLTAAAKFWRHDCVHELEAEIDAQFRRFLETGLALDHVDAHNNMQLHPVVLPVLIEVAKKYGVRRMRLPHEPLVASWRAARNKLAYRTLCWLGLRPWSRRVKRRLLAKDSS